MTRTELYEAVWSQPVATVATSLGISDSGLATVCKRFEIPRPPRGYWRRVKTGQILDRPPLPKPGSNPEVPLTIDGARALGVSTPRATALGELSPSSITEPKPEVDQSLAAERFAKANNQASDQLSSDQLSSEQAVRRYAAVEAEIERAMNAGVKFQRHQAA